jgi:hypothetical protein
MRDKYNLNLLPKGAHGEENEYDESESSSAIPGFGGLAESAADSIPGLDNDLPRALHPDPDSSHPNRKVPYSKPVPKQFADQWAERPNFLPQPNQFNDQRRAPPGSESEFNDNRAAGGGRWSRFNRQPGGDRPDMRDNYFN